MRIALTLLTAVLMTGLLHAEDTVEGILIERPNGQQLLVALVESRFELRFLDEEGMETEADVDRVSVRYNPPMRSAETIPLSRVPGRDGYTNPRFIRGPHAFLVTVMLFRGEEGGAPAESHLVDFPGEPVEWSSERGLLEAEKK